MTQLATPWLDSLYRTIHLKAREGRAGTDGPLPDSRSESCRLCSGGRYRIRTYDFHRVRMALYR
jgi:hypothetical protein